MNSIGEKIAELRKAKSMTQEELASTIGVSSQSVSKWETGATMPDIMLLPLIADIFGIKIDEFFGRSADSAKRELSGAEFIGACRDGLIENIHRYFWSGNDYISYDGSLEIYKNKIKSEPDVQTAVIRDDGAVYYKEDIGGLILVRPKDGWLSYLKDRSAAALLTAMGDAVFCDLLIYALELRSPFTVSAAVKKCAAEESKTAEAVEKMCSFNMLSKKTLDIDDKKIDIYEIICGHKIYELFAAAAFAKQFLYQKEHYSGYSGGGDFYMR